MVQSLVNAGRPPDPTVRPRERLLQAAIDFVAEFGLKDRSLREIAAAIGTSHRMLIYHFGSKEGLMRAIVEEVERQQREFFARFIAEAPMPPLEAGYAFWRRLSDPSLANNVRLFFEVYAQALGGQAGTEGFLDHIVDAWVEPLAEYEVSQGVAPEVARADARLGVAVSRGLLLDLVATGNRDEVDAAFQRYLELFRSATGG
jgi:AcrR family transcriptional regulator